MTDQLSGVQPEIVEIPQGWLRLRPWREFSALALLVMDINWILPLFQSITETGARQEPLFAGAVMGAVILIGYVLARLMFYFQIKVVYRQGFLTVGMLMASIGLIKSFLYPHQRMGVGAVLERMSADFSNPLVLLPAELMLVLLAALLWWRGVQLANRWLGPGSARRSFRLGMVMLLVVAFIRVDIGLENLLPHLALFTFSGLVAVGAARAASLSQLRGANQEPLTMNWLAGMLAIAVGTVGAAAAFAVFLSGQLSGWILTMVLWAVRLTLAAMLIVVSPILLVVLLAFTWLSSLIDDSPVLQAMQEELVEVVQNLADILFTVGGFLRDIWLALPSIPWIKPLMLWTFIALVLIVMIRRFGVRWRIPFLAKGGFYPSESETLPSDLLASMKNWLEQGVQQIGQQLTRLGVGGKLVAAARIRRIYLQLMTLSAELGAPRLEWQTPLEFMVTLHGLFPDHGDALVAVTGAYVRVRYGELPESHTELTRVEKAWKELKTKGQQLKKASHILQEHAQLEKMRSDFTMRRSQ